MSDYLAERVLTLDVRPESPSLIKEVEMKVMRHLMPGEIPVRFAVTESREGQWDCDVGVYEGGAGTDSIFRFEKRAHEETDAFNVVMLVPTGIGADIGGHAG